MSKPDLTLYQREECPFSGLVRKKLTQLNLSAKMIVVDEVGDKRADVIQISGQKAVPVLKDGDQVIVDSAKIIEYLDARYGDGNNDPMPATNYGLRTVVEGSFEEVKQLVVEIFQEEGFGVLTEINVQATLKKKLGVDLPPNTILGMCNPTMAHKAMEMEPDLGLLLPCNVVIREESEGKFLVSAIHPVRLFSVVGRNDMIQLALQVMEMLKKALARIEAEG